VRQERHYNLLTLQPPTQVEFGGRKNRPSPGLCLQTATRTAFVSLDRLDTAPVENRREEGGDNDRKEAVIRQTERLHPAGQAGEATG
jgi:hypothetical protein